MDAAITYKDTTHEIGHYAFKPAELTNDNRVFVKVYRWDQNHTMHV